MADEDLEGFSPDELWEFREGLDRLIDTVLQGKLTANAHMKARAYLNLKKEIEDRLTELEGV